ncbi:MAG: RNA polymerase sigma factor [Candidatus Limnocylindria bacterium]
MSRRAQPGEAEFAHLFEEFSAPIFNYVLRMVGDADRAADITQDTFIKAYRKLDTVTDATSTRSWLYRIATNTAIDDMRRRRMVTPMSDDQPAFANRADQRPGPEAQVMAGTLDERVQRALATLRPNHRQCLLLSDLEDMSAQQIGAVMNLSYGAVRTLLCRARGEMRQALAAEGFAR